MPDHGQIVPVKADNASTTIQSPVEMSIDELSLIIHRDNIPKREKVRLIRQEIRALVGRRARQIELAARVGDYQAKALEDQAVRAVDLEKEQFVLGIRKTFIAILAGLGSEVEEAARNLMADFAENLEEFEQRLEGRNIKEARKQVILEEAEEGFKRICNQLRKMAQEYRSAMDQHGGRAH